MSIRESLLALLASGPRHGYQLRAEFEQHTGGIWPLNIGQVYSTLERLERDGLVAGGEPDGEGRRSFDLTAEGREALQRFLGTHTADEIPQRDELMLKVLTAIATDSASALEVIHLERAGRMATLQSRRRALRDSGVNGDLAANLAFDALVARIESELRWLDICEERLLELRRNPTPHTNGANPKETV